MKKNDYFKRSFLVSLMMIIVPAISLAKGIGPRVIYGEDNRVDVQASDNPFFIELSRGTAAMIPHTSIVRSRQGNEFKITGRSFRDVGMCEEERFSHQITAARCSGFLVGEDLLVTAGHCVSSASDCQNYSWVFDYKATNESSHSIHVPSTSVYRCKEIIAHALDYSSSDDYTLLRLEKSVRDRSPLEFRKEGIVSVGTPLVVIGHPSGLPTKIADGANVRQNQSPAFFVANLDTYGGNSGSAVFDAETGVVEGILVRGEVDYIQHPSKNCRISNRCLDHECRGEDVTRITNIKELSGL